MAAYFSHWYAGDLPHYQLVGVFVLDAVLVAVLAICAYTDGRFSRIPNVVTFPAMLAGIVLNGIFGGVPGLVWGLIGWAVGMSIQWVPFMLGFAKAGDVKLLAAVGALKGWAFCIFGFLYGAAAFAFLILPWLYMRGELGQVGQNIRHYFMIAAVTQSAPDAPTPVVTKRFVPWGVALAIGFFIALILELTRRRPVWFV
jgi:prepilin peptidase CpaA